MTHTEISCALCNLPVLVRDFRLWKKSGEPLHFCCEACRGVYEMLHESELKEEPTLPPNTPDQRN